MEREFVPVVIKGKTPGVLKIRESLPYTQQMLADDLIRLYGTNLSEYTMRFLGDPEQLSYFRTGERHDPELDILKIQARRKATIKYSYINIDATNYIDSEDYAYWSLHVTLCQNIEDNRRSISVRFGSKRNGLAEKVQVPTSARRVFPERQTEQQNSLFNDPPLKVVYRGNIYFNGLYVISRDIQDFAGRFIE